jgi:hypothetical protein
MDPREGKACTIANITAETIFQNFESLLLVDAGAADGFTITDEAGGTGLIPTGVPISIGGPGAKPSKYIKVTAAPAKSLNVTYILYQ